MYDWFGVKMLLLLVSHSVGHLYQSRLLLRRGAAWSHQMEFKMEHDWWWKLGVSNIVCKYLEHIFCFVGSYSLLIEIYINFHDCKWKFWALMFDSHFYWSHPRNSWLQTVTQKKVPAVTFRLFHSAGRNPAVVRCEQTPWESSECWNWSISTRDNEWWTNEITR